MKKNLTELVFILDRSGSMAGLESDTLGGYNSFLKKQKAVEGECVLTTVLFDDQYELLHDRINIQAVAPLTEKDYYVRGCTALLDALGKTIQKIKQVQANTAEDYRAEKVLFVIITDGYENSSREYTTEKVKAMIEAQKAKGWEFIFLGANMDAVETASQFGIGADRAVDYLADEAGTELNFRAMSEAVSEFRAVGKVPEDALESIRLDAAQRSGKPKRSAKKSSGKTKKL